MMKKLFLLGAAGLAALSISCSDDDGDEGSGSFTKAFTVTDADPQAVIGGQITAAGDNKVESVSVKAGVRDVTIQGLTLPSAVVDLDGKSLNGVCTGVSGAQTINFVITATFTDDVEITASADNIPINCPVLPGEFVWSFNLSSTGFSYYDLDGKALYKRATAPGTTDIIAFEDNTGSNIYSGNGYNKFGTQAKINSQTDIYVIPGGAQGQAAARTTLANITGATDPAIPGFTAQAEAVCDDDDNAVESIAIANDTVFLVWTESGDYFAVIVETSNTTGKTVKLKAYGPF
jgi:hypothetical protein